MSNQEMLIDYVPGEECRIAITEEGVLEEFYQERASNESHVGNIYKGQVVSVEASIQAAFVDFGIGRNGFLHISDVHPKYFPGKSREETETVGKKTSRKDRPPVQQCLKRGQQVLVQVLKEGLGTKGPTVTTYLSIPGRFLVMMPDMERHGVSRKVDDEEQRRDLKRILDDLKPPKEFGFIVRTAGSGRTKTELKRDLAYLQRLWRTIEKRQKQIGRTGELYTESDLIIRTIRDIFTTDVKRIIVNDATAAQRARDFLAIASPRAGSHVYHYDDPVPIFYRYGIEPQIEQINARTVTLPSGGSIILDQTEALVAIDVNSGKMRQHGDAETTAYQSNLEAAEEICRQLRLRDLGGVVVCDLIDMRAHKHRKAVEQKFKDLLKRDRARSKTTTISAFGLLEMTRQRMRPSLRTSTYALCRHCEGDGRIKSPESVLLQVMRRLAIAMQNAKAQRIELTVSPDVAFRLLNGKRGELVRLETTYEIPVTVRVSQAGRGDYVEIEAFDASGRALDVERIDRLKEAALQTVEVSPALGEKGGGEASEAGSTEASEGGTHGSAEGSGTEAAQEGGGESGGEEAGEGERRSRRRRRGRGRGRGRRRGGERGEGEEAGSKGEVKEAAQDAASSEKETADASGSELEAAKEGAPEQRAGEGEEGEGSGSRRRRRRRGRRGRGRKRQGEAAGGNGAQAEKGGEKGKSESQGEAGQGERRKGEGEAAGAPGAAAESGASPPDEAEAADPAPESGRKKRSGKRSTGGGDAGGASSEADSGHGDVGEAAPAAPEGEAEAGAQAGPESGAEARPPEDRAEEKAEAEEETGAAPGSDAPAPEPAPAPDTESAPAPESGEPRPAPRRGAGPALFGDQDAESEGPV